MSLKEKDQQFIWHPYTAQKKQAFNIPIVRAKGSLLFDAEGSSYIDAISSWWVNLHGHGHPYIAQKIYEQALELEHVIFAGFTHKPAVELAERLLPLLPGSMEKMFYSDNGSTAVEVALKMALQFWWNQNVPRKKILAFNNAYHGDTFGAMSVSGRSIFTDAFADHLIDVVFIDTPTTENISELKTIVQQHANDLACFIYEPLVQGAGGMKMYDAYMMNELLNTVKLNDIICIADEVMTGFGRTGKLFASNYMHKQPDIVCLSKGITGGTMALGATACNKKIHDAFVVDEKLKTFFHGHSFTANPIACAAALASLDLLEKEETQKAIDDMSIAFANFTASIKDKTTVSDPRSLGTILAFEMGTSNHDYLNDLKAAIVNLGLSNGVLIRPLGNTVYVLPPYCMTKDEQDKILDVLNQVIEDIKP
jgi:adenosylmethionine---8-amino-7-oxononanoate aminotransferase